MKSAKPDCFWERIDFCSHNTTSDKELSPLVKNTKSHKLFFIKNQKVSPSPGGLDSCDLGCHKSVHIDSTSGIEAAIGLIKDCRVYSEAQISLFKKLFNVILYNNYFLFKEQFFIQLTGVAMGSNVAPPYACSFMNDFEQRYIFINENFQRNCATWWRYIDDIFAVWRGNIESLKIFDETLNGFSLDIQFKMHVGVDSVPFLDTRVYLEHGQIETDLYTKPTDRKQLLMFDSYHPP